MQDIYKDNICRSSICPFVGKISESTKIADSEIKYVDCKRDNEDAKNHFFKTLQDENYQWLRHEVNFMYCLFAPENIKVGFHI